MPLMTVPSRRSRRSGPRLRNRSLPRLRIGGSGKSQPQHHDCEDLEDHTVSKDLRHHGPTKTRRRSYSLPKRLITRKAESDGKEVVIDVREESLDTSASTEVEVSLRRRQRVSFGDSVKEEKFESPFDNKELSFDETQVWYQESDYVRFQKDRILTSFDYQASVQNNKVHFDHEAHSIRGLELVTHPRYSRKLNWEKKDLWKALQKEEAHQKETGKFPNLERFKVVSQRYTKDAKNRAASLGAEDAKDVLGKNGKSWFSRAFGAPVERGVNRHRSMDSGI